MSETLPPAPPMEVQELPSTIYTQPETREEVISNQHLPTTTEGQDLDEDINHVHKSSVSDHEDALDLSMITQT